MKGDPTKYPEWYKNYLRGIMQVESSGGNPDEFINPGSSATGMYQQLYKQVKDLPVMQGVDRQGFAADTALQNKVMGMRFLDDLPGVTGELRNARDLTERFQPQFGDKWNYRPDEVAAMTYFIGRQGTINYLNHLLKGGKPEDFKVSGNNMTVPKYMQVYNEGFGVEEEQPEERQISPELQNAIDIMKRDNRFGGRVLKKKNYGQDGMLVQKDPTLQQDPPQGTITAQEALMRALQPENQFRLTGGDAPFRPIKEQRDPVETLGKGIAEAVRMLPFAGEVIDTYELGKVAATGEDVYGQEQDPGLFAALTAAGYVIPNVLEKPLKSAWRAVKQFPSKMPKKEFRELMGPEKEQVRSNLIQAQREAYDVGPIPFNVRQLPSLMSGSKLENAVGKDGLIQVSQIENLINSKDVSTAEREALQDALFKARVQQGEAAGLASGEALPDKIDYLSFKRAGSDVVSTRRGDATFFVDETDEYAEYGLNNLGDDIRRMKDKDGTVTARTNLIRTTDPELQSSEYGHFGNDVIGHYRTFDRADEPGVLYISEMQSDPLQARGPAGQKTVGLDFNLGGGPTAKQANLIKNQDQFLISHILENEAKGADKLRFPTGETTSKIQGYGDQTQRISRAKSDVSLYENISKEARENELVNKAFKEHPMFKGKSEDEIVYILDGVVSSRPQGMSVADSKVYSEYEQGFRALGGSENTTRQAVFDWYDATKKLRSSREHLSRINASEQATQGIMKGYDRLPKALKKHGLDATKVTDDVGNTWWEVDIPARLGEGVGEIRAYRKGGQVSDKIRVLKKEGKPQDQAVAIALAMKQKGQI